MRLFFLILVLLNVIYYFYQIGDNRQNRAVNNYYGYLKIRSNRKTIQTKKPTENKGAYNLISIFSIGPFLTEADASKSIPYLLPGTRVISYKTRTDKMVQSYWVYLPYQSQIKNKINIKKLNKDGYNKYYIVSHGQYKNSISLGLFKKYSDALTLLNFFKKNGINAFYKINYKNRKTYWINFISIDTYPSLLKKINVLDYRSNNIIRLYQGYGAQTHSIM